MQSLTPPLVVAGVSAILAWLIGPPVVALLARISRQPIASTTVALDQLRRDKQFTPTLGGVIVLLAWLGGLIANGVWDQNIVAAMGLVLGLGSLGLIDDWAKVRRQGKGLNSRQKSGGQTLIAIAVLAPLLIHDLSVVTLVTIVSLAWGVLVIVASSNAFNLTDGLDGLASGCGVCGAVALALLTAWQGEWTLSIMAAALAGALLGFLRVNAHPAHVFMGDLGALAIGGLLGFIAWRSRHELSWVIIGSVFVIETLSVILQVQWYRRTGQRLFRCAPLHHHFQLLGWNERTIVRAFWSLSVLAAIVGVAARLGWNGWHNSPVPIARENLAEVSR